MELVKGYDISDQVPLDLPALRISVREAADPLIRVCAVGDIGLSGRATTTAARHGADRLFADVSPLLRAAHVTFGNLESPLAGDIAPGGHFAAPAAGAASLRHAGFDLIHLANNHVGEYGQRGLAETLRGVLHAELRPLGAGSDAVAARALVRTDCNGVRIGWLGCGRTLLSQPSDGVCYWEFDERQLLDEVRRARAAVDVLILSIHIGLMYISYPRPEHKSLAERLMTAGADLILMHHAHVLQGVEVSAGGRVCCFNLGNFVYDWQEGNVAVDVALNEQNESAVFVFDIDRRGVSSLAVLPIWIDGDCCARWATGCRGDEILRRFRQITEALTTDFARMFADQRAVRNTGGILKVLAFHARHGNWRVVGHFLRRTKWEHIKMAAKWASRRITTEN